MAESRLLYYEESCALDYAEQIPVNYRRKTRVIIANRGKSCSKHLNFSKWIPPFQKQLVCLLLKLIFSFLFRHSENAIPDCKWRRILDKYFIHSGKKIVKHWTEIYACSYQIIRYHNQFTWLKMWKNLLMRYFFKQSYFFSFFSISFINLLAFNEKGTKHNKMKSCYILGQERHSCKLEIRFLNYFVDVHFGQWSKQYSDTSQCTYMTASTYHRPGEELPRAAFKDSEGQGCAGSGKSASNRYNRYYI